MVDPELSSPTGSIQSAPSSLPTTSFPSTARQVHQLPVLKEQLQKVALARANYHVRKVAILVRWLSDNSNAEDDVTTMANLMEDFDIQHESYNIRKTDMRPTWRLSQRIREITLECEQTEQHCLIVFYYAGHGDIIDGGLNFVSGMPGTHPVPWSKIKPDLFAEEPVPEKIDVLTILDCCYAGAATRSGSQVSRTTQIIAACSAHQLANPRAQKTSFTLRIFRAVQKFKGQQTSLTTTALFQEIRREADQREEQQRERGLPTTPKPIMETLTGIQPIKLHFKDTTMSSSSSPSRIPHPSRKVQEKNVLVKLTLQGHRREFEVFKKAIEDLPDIMKVDVTDAYKTTQSIFILLNMSWESWAMWTMVADLEFVGITCGPSLLQPQPLAEIPIRAFGENRRPGETENTK
ncbi:hypothetical protein VN97_g2799 [Penicillium thymicola]|uniref:Peptidase C14 caspase domain-containing protein n=1 Tax=Penicillium thymicola TaxID=293382 RepID=A0AAI9TNF3_PENTH|nr:hypothetical protein VN97_g2799 [Penicillium thymicola]